MLSFRKTKRETESGIFSGSCCKKTLRADENKEVQFPAEETVVGEKVKKAVSEMKDGDVLLLENTRFRPEEEKNEDALSKDLASIADIFVNDAFGTAHRAHCSNVGVTKYVDTCVVGYLMKKKIDYLGNAVNNPERPFCGYIRRI